MNPDVKNQASRQSWLIVLFGFLTLALAFSARASLSLVMPVWQEELEWSRGFVSNVGAVALIVMAIIAPFAGRLVDEKGPRFTLSIGLIALMFGCFSIAITSNAFIFSIAFAGISAIGFGLIATHTVSTAVARSFDRKQGLATGIAISGATAGQFIFVPLIAALLTFASWRWSFAGIGVMCIFLIPCLLWYLREKGETPAENETQAFSSSMLTDFKKICRIPTFHLLFWSYFICGVTTTGVIETHFMPYAAWCGFPPIPSATAYGFLSIINLVGMIAVGWLTDKVNRPLLLGTIYILRGFTFIVLGSMPGASFEQLLLFAILFGAVDYSTIPVTASLVASHVGLKVMGLTMGLLSAGHSIGGALGAFYGGYLFDTTGDYALLWTVSLWLAVLAGILCYLIPDKNKKPDAITNVRAA